MRIEEVFEFDGGKHVELPYFTMSVAAGIPVPADDHVDQRLDLNEFIIKHPATTFFVRVSGEGLDPAGVLDGDLLVVDQALDAQDGDLVIASINGEMTVKTFRLMRGESFLESQNGTFLPMKIEPYVEFSVHGVVTHVIHSMK